MVNAPESAQGGRPDLKATHRNGDALSKVRQNWYVYFRDGAFTFARYGGFRSFGRSTPRHHCTSTVVSVVDTDFITPNHEFDETDSLEIVTVLFDGTETRHPDR